MVHRAWFFYEFATTIIGQVKNGRVLRLPGGRSKEPPRNAYTRLRFELKLLDEDSFTYIRGKCLMRQGKALPGDREQRDKLGAKALLSSC